MMRFTATFAMLIFFNLATVPFGWAFDWNNKTWKDSGCPNNFQGIWIARELPDHPAQSYRVTDNIISFQSSRSIESSHQYQVISKEGHYFILKISPDNLQELIFTFPFLKVRPYQVNQANKDSEPPKCFIKVFHYDNRKNAEYGKYKDWNIFLLNPLEEVNRR